jgi:hypothetical protein
MLDRLKGQMEYYLRPSLKEGKVLFDPSWRGLGPMNGQRSRQEATWKILEAMHPSCIIETGTYRGITTEFLAEFGVPVHTIEVNPRLHAYAQRRLRHYRNVTCHLGRSFDVLQRLQAMPNAFFYLDAHWDADVPVREELTDIARRWEHPVVMIDDFHVPGDSYGWLDRGPDRELKVPILGLYASWPRFYPAKRAYQETGQNTGWTVLMPAIRTNFDSIEELRRGPS